MEIVTHLLPDWLPLNRTVDLTVNLSTLILQQSFYMICQLSAELSSVN